MEEKLKSAEHKVEQKVAAGAEKVAHGAEKVAHAADKAARGGGPTLAYDSYHITRHNKRFWWAMFLGAVGVYAYYSYKRAQSPEAARAPTGAPGVETPRVMEEEIHKQAASSRLTGEQERARNPHGLSEAEIVATRRTGEKPDSKTGRLQ